MSVSTPAVSKTRQVGAAVVGNALEWYDWTAYSIFAAYFAKESLPFIGLPDPKWVEAVTAVIVVKAGHSLTEAEVLTHCTTHMAGFKAPKRVVFTDTLPKNPSGKLLKRELRQRYTG